MSQLVEKLKEKLKPEIQALKEIAKFETGINEIRKLEERISFPVLTDLTLRGAASFYEIRTLVQMVDQRLAKGDYDGAGVTAIAVLALYESAKYLIHKGANYFENQFPDKK